jgi:hypothetical protein
MRPEKNNGKKCRQRKRSDGTVEIGRLKCEEEYKFLE